MQMRRAFVGFCDTDYTTEANEANFAVFCQNFAQIFLTNQKLLKFPGIPDFLNSGIPDRKSRLLQFPGIPD